MFDFLFKPWIRHYTYRYRPFCIPMPGRGWNGCQQEAWASSSKITEEGLLAGSMFLCLIVLIGSLIIGRRYANKRLRRRTQLKGQVPDISDEDCATLVAYYPEERLVSLVSVDDVNKALAWARLYKVSGAVIGVDTSNDVDFLIAHLRPEKIADIRGHDDYKRALKACKKRVYSDTMFT